MFKTVHVQHVHLASTEWSSSGIMETVAKEILDQHKDKFTDDTTVAVHVYEHAGWSLVYTLDREGNLMVVGSANDAAQWEGEKARWRERAYNAKWDHISPPIRRDPQ